jgi:hypothetical protein
VRKKGKESFVVPDSNLVGCGTVSTGKRCLTKENIGYIFRIVQWKNNGILFTKMGHLCLLYQNLTTNFKVQ